MIKNGDIVEIEGWRGEWEVVEVTDDFGEPYFSFEQASEKFVLPVIISPDIYKAEVIIPVESKGEMIRTKTKWPAEDRYGLATIGVEGLAGFYRLDRIIPLPPVSHAGGEREDCGGDEGLTPSKRI